MMDLGRVLLGTPMAPQPLSSAARRCVTSRTPSPCVPCATRPVTTGTSARPVGQRGPATCLTTLPPSSSPSSWLCGVSHHQEAGFRAGHLQMGAGTKANILWFASLVFNPYIFSKTFIYLFGCSGSSWLRGLFFRCGGWGLLSWCGAQALRLMGLYLLGSGAQAQWLCMDLVALRHVGSSQTRE